MTETIRNDRPCPCRGCPDRYPACSDHCRKESFLAWKAEQQKIREARKNYRQPAWFRDQSYDRRWKTSKK
ncbi:MAG: hypothetical protein IJN67_11835 [Oscillospiraceae bacterium]|nr:hypothetical protein [Oscillospiraceae bacterium]